MMEAFVLIMMLSHKTHDEGGIVTQEFSSKARCENAKNVMSSTKRYTVMFAECVPK